jgi:hypothetical protein
LPFASGVAIGRLIASKGDDLRAINTTVVLI